MADRQTLDYQLGNHQNSGDGTLGGNFQTVFVDRSASLLPIVDGRIGGEYRENLERTLRLIAMSVTRETNDDKVLDLCTALEALLTSRHEKRKGEAIAVRMMLLAAAVRDGFTYPDTVFLLYELRSRISHGSERGECGETEARSLLSVARRVLYQVLTLLAADAGITTFSKLIAAIETKQELQSVID